jgi:hypothetical protein
MSPSFLRRWRRRWRDARKIRRWRREGGGQPVPHAFKRRVVLEHARRYGCSVLVETGTWHGDMVEATKRAFDRVVSIELDVTLAQAARARFAADAQVRILQGDSAQVIGEVLADLREPTLFWLDGHSSGGDTARGTSDTPVREELEAVLSHRVPGHVVLIDDAHLFTGEGDYPSLDDVRAQVTRLRPGSSMETRDGIIRILPADPSG